MKYTLKNLRSFFLTEKMIFLLIIVCIVTSSFIINFSYGLYQNFHVKKAEEAVPVDNISIPFRNDLNGQYVSKQSLKNAVNGTSFKYNRKKYPKSGS